MKNVYKTINRFRNSDHSAYVKWYLLICYYMVARIFFGLSYGMIYGFIAILILLRIPLGHIVTIFLCNSIIAYIFGSLVEANQYLSFVWGFMVCIVLKELFIIITAKHNSPK